MSKSLEYVEPEKTANDSDDEQEKVKKSKMEKAFTLLFIFAEILSIIATALLSQRLYNEEIQYTSVIFNRHLNGEKDCSGVVDFNSITIANTEEKFTDPEAITNKTLPLYCNSSKTNLVEEICEITFSPNKDEFSMLTEFLDVLDVRSNFQDRNLYYSADLKKNATLNATSSYQIGRVSYMYYVAKDIQHVAPVNANDTLCVVKPSYIRDQGDDEATALWVIPGFILLQIMVSSFNVFVEFDDTEKCGCGEIRRKLDWEEKCCCSCCCCTRQAFYKKTLPILLSLPTNFLRNTLQEGGQKTYGDDADSSTVGLWLPGSVYTSALMNILAVSCMIIIFFFLPVGICRYAYKKYKQCDDDEYQTKWRSCWGCFWIMSGFMMGVIMMTMYVFFVMDLGFNTMGSISALIFSVDLSFKFVPNLNLDVAILNVTAQSLLRLKIVVFTAKPVLRIFGVVKTTKNVTKVGKGGKAVAMTSKNLRQSKVNKIRDRAKKGLKKEKEKRKEQENTADEAGAETV